MKILNLNGRIVNSYFAENNGTKILVDTGYFSQYPFFKKNLEKNGLKLSELDYVFLTHAHDDHAGFLNEVLRNSNAKLVLDEKAVEWLQKGCNPASGGFSNKSAARFGKLMDAVGKGGHKYPPLDAAFSNRFMFPNENTESELKERLNAQIVKTSGHTECSISLFFEDGTLFCGDAAMNGALSKRNVSAVLENVEDYCASWRKIIALAPKIIYAGHGKPFTADKLEKNLAYAEKTVIIKS